MVEYCLGRMIGFEQAAQVTDTLVEDASGDEGVMTVLQFGTDERIEIALARLAALIATSEEFSFR